MKRSDFNFDLPEDLIAQYPSAERTSCRLMTLNPQTQSVDHYLFKDILNLLRPGDLIVFNDTKVIPARLFGTKPTGGKVEVFLERLVDPHHALVQIKASKTPKSGAEILLDNNVSVFVTERQNDFFLIQSDTSLIDIFETQGHVPLPPYIQRNDEELDQDRYQTVYARQQGAIAAPTAGLHFDEDLIDSLKEMGVETAFVTLHVGAGTFQNIRVEEITDHKMHDEFIEVDETTSQQINKAKQEGRRIIAVGTTTVRTLESVANDGLCHPYTGMTNIFIYPSYQFQLVDAMVTNFHLPESTLLMLVSAFSGLEGIKKAYKEAVEKKYQFFSYGDAMFLEKQIHEI